MVHCSTRREKNIWSIFEIISTMSSKCHKETLKLISESEIPLDEKSKSCFRYQSKYMRYGKYWGGDNFIMIFVWDWDFSLDPSLDLGLGLGIMCRRIE